MVRALIIIALALIAWRMVAGRWPWQSHRAIRPQAVADARKLLGVGPAATREEIHAAHRRCVAAVHPDRGGSSAQVHEVNAARELLLGELPRLPKERA